MAAFTTPFQKCYIYLTFRGSSAVFCPSFDGRRAVWLCIAFYIVSGYLCGFRSFRRSVGLLVRCLRWWLLPWFRSAVLAPFPAVVPDPLPGSDALPVLASYIARCGRLLWFGCRSSSVTASGVLCGFPCVVLDAGGVWAWFPCMSSGGFWAWLWCGVCSACPGAVLGIICPSFFRVPFRILCGFFCFHCSIYPAPAVAAGGRSPRGML